MSFRLFSQPSSSNLADSEISAGRQRLVKRNWKFSVVPSVVLIVLILVLGWEMLRQNMNFYEWPWSISLIGIAPAATLVGIFASLLIARGQFARSMRPSLAWSTSFDQSIGLPNPAWIVRLMNFGPGPANIERISYALHMIRQSGDIEKQQIGRHEFVGILNELGLQEGRDYSLNFITPGAPLPVMKAISDALEFAAFSPAVIERMQKMNFTVRVIDTVGDHHEKSLPFIATLPAAWQTAGGTGSPATTPGGQNA